MEAITLSQINRQVDFIKEFIENLMVWKKPQLFTKITLQKLLLMQMNNEVLIGPYLINACTLRIKEILLDFWCLLCLKAW